MYLKEMVELRLLRKRNTKLQQELLEREALQEENVVEVKDLSQIEEITGSNTAAIFDTNITHKQGSFNR